ncbi:MAG: asparagine synthase (glutamine-hydrolyzing) [Bacteroidetes bacterium]|nr:asparagine synthase (glutamine-hydrolyzing) [Bacteroidota bacterium]
MCGIAGVHGLRGIDDPGRLVRHMTDALAHRGPDAEGAWTDDAVALGHRRLSIIDLSHASDQPFHSADGRYVIAFNGEIYNYQELRAELERQAPVPPAFRTRSDTEVLLAAYATWGAACLPRLKGMFAFAIWDRAQRELFIARDRLGVKPLYIHESDGRLLFASELRALLASGLVPRKLDPASLVDYVRYQTVHAPATIVRGVRMLMPGHWLRVGQGRIEQQCWWDPITSVRTDAAGLSPERALKEVREHLARAVERRLVADVPFGAFLSGGIDSSAIVGLMAEVSHAPLHTFSVVFDESEFSEERFARIVAGRFGTHHTAIRLRPEDILAELPDVFAAMDHPSGDGPNTYVVSKVTKRAGITMALSGLGSDEIFAGYPVFKRSLAIQRARWLTRVPSVARRGAAALLTAVKPSRTRLRMAELLRSGVAAIDDTYPLSRRILNDQDLAELTGSPLPPDRVQGIMRTLLREQQGHRLPLLSQVSLGELSTYLPNILLRDTDQMSMAHALEVRVPFLDHELVELVLGIGDALKYPHTPKPLLVRALGDLLPREIVERPKMGFALPWIQWMRGALREFCAVRLEALGRRGVLHPEALDRTWGGFLAGDMRISWARLWHLVVLEDWLERNAIEV